MTSWQASDCKIDCQMKFLLLKSNIFSVWAQIFSTIAGTTLSCPAQRLCVSSPPPWFFVLINFKSLGRFHVVMAIMTVSYKSQNRSTFTTFNFLQNRINSIKIRYRSQFRLKIKKLDIEETKEIVTDGVH